MRMRSIHTRLLTATLLAGLAAAAAPVSVFAQEAAVQPNVFFDCGGRNCNSQYYRTEIDWVNWVNDQAVSDVHVIMSSVRTGVGGREYQLDFIGREAQDGYVDQLLFQSLPTDTRREELDGITHTLGLGLARFANVAGYRGIVSLRATDQNGANQSGERVVSQEEVDDPWKLWVFRVNGSGNVSGEETRKTERLNGSLNVSRVTPTWKLNFNGNVDFRRQEVDLEEGTFRDSRIDWGFNPLAVYTLADHWSVGVQGQTSRATRFNQDFRVEVTPALEYSVFPYEEATRRSFTFFYKIGAAYRDYIEETIFGETAETRWEQSMEIELSQRQTWGDAGVSIRGSHFLYDLDRNNLSLRGDINFRVVRGFSVNARANIAWVNDQIYLSARGVTDEEALLRLQQRGTDFNYGMSIGFSIQFGSIFNNVVNNRFRGGRGSGDGRRF
jgi:hypothetical protein